MGSTKNSKLLIRAWETLIVQQVKNLLAVQEMREMWVQSLGQEDALEEGVATHTSILVWRIHGQKSLEGYSPQGHKELDTTERVD